jgi:hypothetical protein
MLALAIVADTDLTAVTQSIDEDIEPDSRRGFSVGDTKGGKGAASTPEDRSDAVSLHL